jgi:DNA-binding CsgD family transcriptional regulator
LTKPSAVDLTDREIEVLQLIAEGLPPAEVAKRLVIAPKTVASHMQRILAKLDVHTRAQAVAVAYESGLIRVLRTDPDVTGHTAFVAAETHPRSTRASRGPGNKHAVPWLATERARDCRDVLGR